MKKTLCCGGCGCILCDNTLYFDFNYAEMEYQLSIEDDGVDYDKAVIKENEDAIIQHYLKVENSGPETINYVPRMQLLG